MRKKGLIALLTTILICIPFTINVIASPGRLDGNGGHTCRTNCAKYGLKTGQYHYHNSDGSISLSRQTAKRVSKPSATPALEVYINGVKQSYDQSPVIENGRTLVPLRGIFESLGANVQWDQKNQVVTAIKTNTKIVLKIGAKSPTVNGKVSQIDVPAKVRNGRTLVPLRFVGEALGATVDYNSSKRTIRITSK
ncbi:copper amine oxidase N-terminal domain-containing protein [Heyndrickxia oleronia]|uniref:copper amine oxidase N-terminal domain-containing protein n=1 Tax=Heyndrickxia oleronia TaxID=38875 RepID=UPI001C0EDAA1|nr:copper amine oxidase N-terminal domain-containing protein [Heyndrickxia oleronia]MBU5210548.1 copper amine oxidase N-terminal domain-containing protein [Heyndrickxia oleronia]